MNTRPEFLVSDDEEAEINRYVEAYWQIILDHLEPYIANKDEQRKIKNDAEQAGMKVAPNAQCWYDAFRNQMSATGRVFGSPDWNAIFAGGKEVLLGHKVMTLIGSRNRVMRLNKNKSIPVTPNDIAEAQLRVFNVAVQSARNPARQAYLQIVAKYSLIPPDTLLGNLLDMTSKELHQYRRDLKKCGWEFREAQLPEWVQGSSGLQYKTSEVWWCVVKRPPTEEEIKAELKAKLEAKIESLNSSDLSALIELLR